MGVLETFTMIDIEIIADTQWRNGPRITTFLLVYPRFFHQEFLTHRAISRNSASSRAIPTEKIIQQVRLEPCLPWHIGANQPGMVADNPAEDLTQQAFLEDVRLLRDHSVKLAEKWKGVIHKQTVNRYLEPWMKIAVVATATDWANFFHLRCHKTAEPHFREMAIKMCEMYYANTEEIIENYMHLPFVTEEEMEANPGIPSFEWMQISAARCGRVTHFRQGKLEDKTLEEDIARGEQFAKDGHWSPLEHPADIAVATQYYGNFKGWFPLRKYYSDENKSQLMNYAVDYINRP